MEFNYNREQKELLRVMKSKAQKKNIEVNDEGKKLCVRLEPGKFSGGEDVLPVIFKGNLTQNHEGCVLKGKFSYGFYLYTMVIVAAFLIIVRFSWSAYQRQAANMILCGIVTLLLGIVVATVEIKSRPAKKIIKEFLDNLNLRG